jgi:hypothetical protein
MAAATSETLALLTSPAGIAITGVLLATAIILWDWRLTLVVLFAVQTVVGAAVFYLHQTPVQWVLIQTAVMGLACAILAMSAARSIYSSPSARQAGSTSLRVMAVLLVYSAWRLLDIKLAFPGIDSNVAQLFGWLAICALLLLGLGTNPLFWGVALLLWIIPVQAFAATVLEIPSLVALVGILQILVALACSYLIVAEGLSEPRKLRVLTDVAFPMQTTHEQKEASTNTIAGLIGSALMHRLSQIPGRGKPDSAMRIATEKPHPSSRDDAETTPKQHAASPEDS